MKNKEHSNPKSLTWIISLVVMVVISAGVIFGSNAIYDFANKKYNEPVAVDFTIASTEDINIASMNAGDYNVTSAQKALDAGGNVVAYIIEGTTVGYNAEVPIELSTVVTADGAIVASIDVLHQEETEYLGVRVAADDFKGQFAGRYAPVVASTESGKGSKIDVLANSTISSKAVVDGVNNAVSFVNDNFVVAE